MNENLDRGPFEVRPDQVELDRGASLESLMARRAELVADILERVAPEHRAGWREALDPESATTVYAVDDSVALARMVAEVQAIDEEIRSRREPR